MGRMKEVFELKQKLIELDSSLENYPDSYFIDIYLLRMNIGKQEELPESETDAWDGDESDKIQY